MRITKLFVVLILFNFQIIYAQEDPLLNIYMFNYTIYNPAYYILEDENYIGIDYRYLNGWYGYDEDSIPQSSFLSSFNGKI